MDVSIIIPYYNMGPYLPDALESLKPFKNHPLYTCEIIIVNDGSTDALSLALLDDLKDEGYIIINQPNKGLSGARNTGLAASTGKYLLFLDSDNKIRPAIIEKGLPILRNTDAGIVYGRASFFGATTKELFRQDVFHLPTLLARNYIDVCALIKRKVYETIGDYDEAKVLNQEDWEYWIRAAKAGFKFHFVDEVFYDYRIRQDSISSELNDEQYYQARKYTYNKYPELVIDAFFYLTEQFQAYREDKKQPLRSFFKYMYLKYFKKRDTNIPR